VSRNMMDTLTIRIADWDTTLHLSECDDATRTRLADHYAAFIVPLSSNTLAIRVRVEPGPAYIQHGVSRAWQVRSAMREGHLEFLSHFESGEVDWAARQGILVMRSEGDPENFLRVLYAWRCFEAGALLLHASGVIRHGRGYVFFGPSGSGKTTVTRLSQDHTILSDDLVIIKKQGERFRVYGVPFRGTLPESPRTNAAADLQGLFALVKHSEHRVSPMPTPEAIARLSSCVPFVLTHSANARRVTEICAGLSAAVPVRKLYFRRDHKFWEVIDGLE
jgi:hypothetical protein